MRYEFQVIQTLVIDSKHVNVRDEEHALEMLANGWGLEEGEKEIRLVHVGHGEAN